MAQRVQLQDFIQSRFCNCENCITFKFHQCKRQNSFDISSKVEELDPADHDCYIDELEPNEIALKDAIQSDSFIALRSPANSLELFYLFYVLESTVATEEIWDDYGHWVPQGQQFFKGHYLEKTGEMKKFIKYKKLDKKIAFCLPNEVQNIFVSVDPKSLRLPKEEYVALNAYTFRNGRGS